MAKFNIVKTKDRVINYMGAPSYKQSPAEELVFAVVSTFLEDSYYESSDNRLERIEALVSEIAKRDPVFVAKLAIVTRREFHLRSAFHVLVGLLAKYHKGTRLVQNVIAEGVERPDDIYEILAFVGKPIPNQVKKGIAAAYQKFDAYQLAKYRGTKGAYQLHDVFNLVHPKPNENIESLYKDVVEGNLKSTTTWESRLSAGEDHTTVWTDMIASNSLGYMALLRNVRNIIAYTDIATVEKAAAIIADPKRVKASKQLPFRFLSAFKAIEPVQPKKKHTEKTVRFESDQDTDAANAPLSEDKVAIIRDALHSALRVSLENVPVLPGKTIILSDNSGSMRGDAGGASLVSRMSRRTSANIANLFAVLYWMRAENTFVGVFGDDLLQPVLDRSKDIFHNYEIIDKAGSLAGPSTEAGLYTMFTRLVEERTPADRIIIFSDCQVGTGAKWFDHSGHRGDDFNALYETYRKINPNVQTYSVDLKGYGTTLFAGNIVTITGWSEKIFSLMDLNERKEGMVKWVKGYPVDL
jgi:hypothetical protein